MTDVAVLTRAEALALAGYEQIIDRGLKTFVEVGNALAGIRESRLYRTDHATFEAYCRERWGFNDRRASQLISAAALVSTIVETGLPAPANEVQARELAKVPEPQRADVWRATVERTDGKPTAAAVAETARRAAEQRDARALLRRIVDLAAPVNRNAGFVQGWIDQLGAYDEELAELTGRAQEAISVLDDLIEGSAR